MESFYHQHQHQHQHYGHGFLEEILDSNILYGNIIEDQFDQSTLPTTFLETSITSQTSSSFEDFSLPFPQTLNCSSSFGQHFNINPFVDYDHHTASNIKLESSPLLDQDYYSTFSPWDDVQNCHFDIAGNYNVNNPGMPDPRGVSGEPERHLGFEVGKNDKNCKVEGLPSKNLMAERRRRKRLNDRLSMLRSVVPKISKMDRTSILGDTIEYMKELIEKIKHMQEEMHNSSNQLNLMNAKPKETFIRNSPKFEVERRNRETRVEVCCGGKPELLISTMTTLEALGLQIHQCVISCFNDFAMHAYCSQEMEQRVILDPEDIKQALFRNAGYGGKCL